MEGGGRSWGGGRGGKGVRFGGEECVCVCALPTCEVSRYWGTSGVEARVGRRVHGLGRLWILSSGVEAQVKGGGRCTG